MQRSMGPVFNSPDAISAFYGDVIADITFHDLRHDFAHRALEAGWMLEEVAYYLGHIIQAGTPAIQTTIRYTQVSRSQVREKLGLLRHHRLLPHSAGAHADSSPC